MKIKLFDLDHNEVTINNDDGQLDKRILGFIAKHSGHLIIEPRFESQPIVINITDWTVTDEGVNFEFATPEDARLFWENESQRAIILVFNKVGNKEKSAYEILQEIRKNTRGNRQLSSAISPVYYYLQYKDRKMSLDVLLQKLTDSKFVNDIRQFGPKKAEMLINILSDYSNDLSQTP